MTNSDRDAKLGFIRAYLNSFHRKIKRLESILDRGMQEEAITLACCYLGALSSLRYPSGGDKKNFARFIINYSPFGAILGKICVARLIERGKDPAYPQMRGYAISRFEEIREVLRGEASGASSPGDEMDLEGVLSFLSEKLDGLDLGNLRSALQNFTIAAILYEDYRVPGVHRGGMARVHDLTTGEPIFARNDNGEQVYYEDGAVRFSIDFIIELLKECLRELQEECERKVKWPHEL